MRSRWRTTREYGLTGAVYSKNPKKIERAAEEFLVGQSLYQPQVHRRDGGRASVRRIQYVGNGLEGRRPGLSAAVPAGKDHRGKGSERVRPIGAGATRPQCARKRHAYFANAHPAKL